MAEAPSPHGLNSSHHTGTLADSQAPQFLKADGSRELTGDLAVSSGVTVDGVDISVFYNNYTTHLGDPTSHNYIRNLLDDSDVAAPKLSGNDVKIYGDGTDITVTKTLSGLLISFIGSGAGGAGTFSGIKDSAGTGVVPDGLAWILTTDDGVVNVDASGANTLAFSVNQANISHGSIGGVTANQHHNQSHVLATATALGPDHTVSGLTAGQVLKATSATAAKFVQLAHTELSSIGTNTHAQIDTHIAATGTAVHGLGTISTQAAANVAITGGSITGITDLAVADGGTGASTASAARTNLGLVIGTNVQAWDADLDAIAALAKTDGNIIVGNGIAWVAESGATARTSLGLGTGDSPQFTAVNVGHATDTTLTRVSAGLIAVEGVTVTLNTATQTLTNKTLTAPVIATIVNSGTLTLPTSTDTLVGRATTDTLTNKTYSGGTNSGTQAGDHTLSGVVTFSNATSPIVAAKLGPAGGQQHTLPAVTSDTIALLAATQTLANKTLTTPTIASFVNATHTHQNAAGGGQLDHGAALTGLTDDDHTQYLLATGARTGASSSSQTFTVGVIDSSLTASRLMYSNGSKKLSSVSDLTSWIAGTTNQITSTSDGDGSITLSLPQNIHTGATPTFARLTLSQATGTAPMTISSTTVVSNLNADKADGYDFDQDVRITGTPRFARLGIGTAAGGSDALTVVGNIEAESATFDGAVVITDDLSVVYSGYYPLYVNVNTVTPNNSNVGIMTNTPDAQFALDVAGPARAELFIGPHALQLADAEMIVHFDGPRPYETDYSGFSAGHMGQTATETGGVIYRPGKFGKAVQVAEATTNLVTNPSFETGVAGGWAVHNGAGGDLAVVQDTGASWYGSASAKLTSTTVNLSQFYYGIPTNFSSGTTYTCTVWIKASAAANITLKLQKHLSPYNTYTSLVCAATTEWQQFSLSWTASVTEQARVDLYPTAGTTFWIDAVQVEAKAYATPYADGSLGTGHSWSGTAHASTSSRTAASLSYALNVPASSWTAMFYVRSVVGFNDSGGYGKLFNIYASSSNRLTVYTQAGTAGAGGIWTEYVTGGGSPSYAPLNSAGKLNKNQWHHIAFTYDGADLALYIDGALSGQAAKTAWTVDATNLLLCKDIFSSAVFPHADIDDLVILSRAASADEIRAIYESDAPVFAESSVFSFRSPTRSPIWVDEEGMWARAYSGNEAFGIYAGDESKSWGGKTLYDSHLIIGNSTAGYVHWRSGVDTSDPDYGSPVLDIAGELHIKSNSTVDGSLTVGTGGYIKSGATAYNSGTGFWLEYNGGTPRLFIGNSAGNKLTWDGSTLSITGNGSGITSINGGNIAAGTITATQIAASTITGSKIAATTITASNIASGTITATQLAANSVTATQILAGAVTASKISVTDLAAVSATMGTLTMNGVVTLSSGGGLYAGTGTFASPTTGVKLWHSGTVGQIAGYNSGTAQFYAGTDGKLYAGAGAVTLDANGISLVSGTSTPNKIVWLKPSTSNSYAEVNAYESGSTAYLNVFVGGLTGTYSQGQFSVSVQNAARSGQGGDFSISDSGVIEIGTATKSWATINLNGDTTVMGSLVINSSSGLSIADSDFSNYLSLVVGSNLTSDRVLTLTTGDASRTITLSGNPTLADWFDQGVKTSSTPQFVKIGVGIAAQTETLYVNGDALITDELSVTGFVNADDLSVSGVGTFANTGLHLLDTDSSHDLIIKPGSNLTADRALTVTTGDASRTLTMTGDATLNQDVSTAGSPTFASTTISDTLAVQNTQWIRFKYGPKAFDTADTPLRLKYYETKNFTTGWARSAYRIQFTARGNGNEMLQESWYFAVNARYGNNWTYVLQRVSGTGVVTAEEIYNESGSGNAGRLQLEWEMGTATYNDSIEITVFELSAGHSTSMHSGTWSVIGNSEAGSGSTITPSFGFSNGFGYYNNNFAIGTSTDSGYKLDVSGTGRFTGNLTADKIYPGSQSTRFFDDDGTYVTAPSMQMTGTLSMGTQAIKNATSIWAYSTQVDIANSSGNRKFGFDTANGRLWIGGSSADGTPSYALHVNGDAYVDDDLEVAGNLTGGWTAVSFNTGWSNTSTYAATSYKRFGDMVFLRGLPKQTTSTWSVYPTIFTLPVGYRPATNVAVACLCKTAPAVCWVSINTDGTVKWESGGYGDGFISLDGICFSVL